MICFLKVIHDFQQMFLKTLEKFDSKFPSSLGLAWQTAFKKTDVKLVLITDTEMLLIVQKGIRGECVNLLIDM